MKASILTVEEVGNSVASLPVLQLLSYSTLESQLKMVCAIISMGQTSLDPSIYWQNQGTSGTVKSQIVRDFDDIGKPVLSGLKF